MGTKRLFTKHRRHASENKTYQAIELVKADFLAAFLFSCKLSVSCNSGVYVEIWRSAPVPLGATYPRKGGKRLSEPKGRRNGQFCFGQSIEHVLLYLSMACLHKKTLSAWRTTVEKSGLPGITGAPWS